MATRAALIARGRRTSCPRCHREDACQTHELVRRSQHVGAEAELVFMEPVGPACHEWITNHSKAARVEGWVLLSWEVDDAEAVAAAARRRLDTEMRRRWW